MVQKSLSAVDKGQLATISRRCWLKQCVTLLASGILIPEGRAVVHDEVPYCDSELERRLRFTVNFSNPLTRLLTKQKFWMYLPVRSSPSQRLLDIEITADHHVYEDSFGHTLLEIPFDDFPPLSQKNVTISLALKIFSRPAPIVLSGNWRENERFIETDDPRLRAVANQLRRPKDWETARAIYDWVANNIKYAGFLAEDYGALYALIERKGDCTEYAYLQVALARGCGIPARMVGGYVVNRDTAPRAEEYHNWAELYIDGTWHVMDAQKQNWLIPLEHYVALRYYKASILNPLGAAHRFKVEGELNARL